MRRIGANTGLLEEVERFMASEEWVDLRRVFVCRNPGQGSHP